MLHFISIQALKILRCLLSLGKSIKRKISNYRSSSKASVEKVGRFRVSFPLSMFKQTIQTFTSVVACT